MPHARLATRSIAVAMLGHKADLAVMALSRGPVEPARPADRARRRASTSSTPTCRSPRSREYAAGRARGDAQRSAVPAAAARRQAGVVLLPDVARSARPTQNWFTEDFERRKELMYEHGASGRKFAGRVLQVITGSTGHRRLRVGRDPVLRASRRPQGRRVHDALRRGILGVRRVRTLLRRHGGRTRRGARAGGAREVDPASPPIPSGWRDQRGSRGRGRAAFAVDRRWPTGQDLEPSARRRHDAVVPDGATVGSHRSPHARVSAACSMPRACQGRSGSSQATAPVWSHEQVASVGIDVVVDPDVRELVEQAPLGLVGEHDDTSEAGTRDLEVRTQCDDGLVVLDRHPCSTTTAPTLDDRHDRGDVRLGEALSAEAPERPFDKMPRSRPVGASAIPTGVGDPAGVATGAESGTTSPDPPPASRVAANAAAHRR